MEPRRKVPGDFFVALVKPLELQHFFAIRPLKWAQSAIGVFADPLRADEPIKVGSRRKSRAISLW